MTTIDDYITPTESPEAPRRARGDHATGMEFDWNGRSGSLQTPPLEERPTTWDAFIRDAGLDPEEVDVVEPVQVRGWDAMKAGGKRKRMHYYRLTLQRRTPGLDIDSLVTAAFGRGPQHLAPQTSTESAYVVALGDLQLGKVDGDGVEGTVERFKDKTAAAVARYVQHYSGRVVYLIHLGDCIEGHVSQGGANSWRTSLTTTEQVRLYRRLLLEQVRAFAEVAPRVVMVGVPGNHDEAHRPLMTYGDSWAIDAVAAVSEALELAGGYEHVSMLTPKRDELTLTLDICGTIVSMAHGHQFRGGVQGWRTWWQGQQHGRQDPGEADILLAGHKHHLTTIQEGPRTFIQVPALESESTWYRHATGAAGEPGIVTLEVGGGKWWGMEIL